MTDCALLERQVAGLAALLDIEREARQAPTPLALAFLMANGLGRVLPHRLALVWEQGLAGPAITALSGIPQPDPKAPLPIWAASWLKDNAPTAVTAEHRDTPHAPPHALWCPLPGTGAGFALFRDHPFSDGDRLIAQRLAGTFAHARQALKGQGLDRVGTGLKSRKAVLAALLLLAALSALPVRQSVLAPALVAARTPKAVTAPLDGVVAELMVDPYQMVQPGQALVRFDATQAQGRLQTARNSEKVAEADLFKTRQRAFSDPEAGARLTGSAAQLDLSRSEAALAQDILDRATIKAEQAGMALYDDPLEWQGRPVSVGERIMVLADPDQVWIQIFVPADDAFAIQVGDDVSFYLNIAPMTRISAKVTRMAYEAAASPEGFLAYRVFAQIQDGDAPPRIGLKGTATIHGARIPLGLALLRRPLAAARRILWL